MEIAEIPNTPRVRPASPMQRVLGVRNFRLLFIGQGLSFLGDQFYLIAVPWLVLKLTNDPFALGTMMALAGIPRALFMLIGGVFTDRFSPRKIMLISDISRLALTAALTALVLTAQIQLWMLYGFALAFGFVSGFFIPAANAVVPSLVHGDDLQVGNSLFQGTAQITNFIGPVLAGGLVAAFAHAAGNAGLEGIGAALAIDTLTFIASVATLWLMQPVTAPALSADHNPATPAVVLSALVEGVRFVTGDPLLRTIFLTVAAVNFLFLGPLLIGVPVLAQTRLPEGAAAYGIIMSAMGAGNLVGIVVAGVLKIKAERMWLLPVGVVALFGLGVIGIGFSSSTALDFVMLLLMGASNGYLSIFMMTFMQRRTPDSLLGRVMSLIVFANVGLVPVSQALAGALISVNLLILFVGDGAFLVLLGVWLAVLPEMRRMGMQMADV